MSQTVPATTVTASPTAGVDTTSTTPDMKDVTAPFSQQDLEESHSTDRKRGREDDAEPVPDVEVAATAAEVDDVPAPILADGSVAAADAVEPTNKSSPCDQTNTADTSAFSECVGAAPEPETALAPSGGEQEAAPTGARKAAAAPEEPREPAPSVAPEEIPVIPADASAPAVPEEAVNVADAVEAEAGASEETIVDAESEPVAATSEPVEASAESSATAEEPEQVKVTPEPLKVSPPPADAGEAVGAATPMVQEAEAEAVPSQHAVDAVEDDAVPAKPVTTMADAPEAQEVVVEAAAPQAEAE